LERDGGEAIKRAIFRTALNFWQSNFQDSVQVNSSLLKGIFKSLSSNNVDTSKYPYIDTEALSSPKGNRDPFVDATLVFRLLSDIRKEYDSLELFYPLFRHLHVLDIGILGHYMLSCKNIFIAYERLVEYQLLFSNFVEFKYKRENDRILWSLQMPYQIYDDRYNMESLAEFELFLRLRILETLSGAPLLPRHIELFYSKNNSKERQNFFASNFNCKVTFTKHHNVLHYTAGDLNRDIHYQNITLYKNLALVMNSQIHELYKNKTQKNTIISIILNNKEKFPTTIQFVALKLHISVRKLQQILKKEDTNFSRIIGEVKIILAIEYLNRGAKMKVIASKLGYREQGSFTRQFKQLTGINPTEYVDLSSVQKADILSQLSN